MLARQKFITVCNRKFFVYCEENDLNRINFPVSLWVETKSGKNIIHLGNFRAGMWEDGIYAYLRKTIEDHFILKSEFKKLGLDDSYKYLKSIEPTEADSIDLNKLY